MAGPGRRLRSPDALVALGFVAAAATEAVVRHHDRPALMAAQAPGALLLGCLALRRARPLLAMTILAAGAAAGTLVEMASAPLPPGSADAVVPIFALLLLTYSLGAHGTARELAIGSVVPLLLIVVVDLSEPTGFSLLAALPFFALFIIGAPAAAGRLVRVRGELVRRLQVQEHRLQAERLAHTGAALALERVQLADRLHGTLVAGMESLVGRAAVARRATGRREADAIAGIESDARALLSETRTVVVSLASDQVARPRQAAPEAAAGTEARQRPPAAPSTSVLPWMAIAGSAVCLGLMLETRASPGLHVALPVAFLGCSLVAVPLVLVGSRPLLMTAALWAAAALFSALVAPLATMFTAISLAFLSPFTVAHLEHRRRAAVGLGICGLGELAGLGPGSLLSNLAFVAAAWGAGRALQNGSRLVAEVRLSTQRLADQRDANLRRAVLDERARVARELHDSMGHTLTIVALHAGAARRMLASDRPRSAEALQTVERVAQAALQEL